MTYTINRQFNHREHGTIGAVEFTAPEGTYKLDGKELPEASVRYLLNYALRALQDAYAGAGDKEEATDSFNARYKALIDGTVNQRQGTGLSTEQRVALAIVKAWIKDNLSKLGKHKDTYVKADAKGKNKIALAIWESNKDAFAPLVDEEMARREAKAKALAKVKADISL